MGQPVDGAKKLASRSIWPTGVDKLGIGAASGRVARSERSRRTTKRIRAVPKITRRMMRKVIVRPVATSMRPAAAPMMWPNASISTNAPANLIQFSATKSLMPDMAAVSGWSFLIQLAIAVRLLKAAQKKLPTKATLFNRSPADSVGPRTPLAESSNIQVRATMTAAITTKKVFAMRASLSSSGMNLAAECGPEENLKYGQVQKHPCWSPEQPTPDSRSGVRRAEPGAGC